ncbi:MAG: AbrB/MazE/SpoVT family DNA-binding domain-containing protein [Thermoanaerobaculia bacterium]|nr:AbrB/MazE/SpoVT family DNA-binding domain-containing protein [Thermoanaerobaculia bacterium]
MTVTATLTSKGQITIPKEIREALGVDAGGWVDFTLEADGSVRMAVRRRELASVAGLLHRPGFERLSVEEMDEAIARHLAERP